tara:strand:+ start:250 stop:357 length:108 start_codon:yes stop_codon:yes gene_type:complete
MNNLAGCGVSAMTSNSPKFLSEFSQHPAITLGEIK